MNRRMTKPTIWHVHPAKIGYFPIVLTQYIYEWELGSGGVEGGGEQIFITTIMNHIPVCILTGNCFDLCSVCHGLLFFFVSLDT